MQVSSLQFVLVARVCFAVGAFCFALASTAGTAVGSLMQLVAGAVLLMVAIASRREILRYVYDPQVWVTAFLLAAANALLISALSQVPLPTGIVLTQMSALWAIVLAPVFLKRVVRADIISLMLGVIGTLIIVGWEQGSGIGYGLIVISSLCTAVFSYRFGQAAASVDPIPYLAVIMLIGGCVLFPFQPLTELSSTAVYAALGAAACFAIGNLSNLRGMREVSAHRTLLLKPVGMLITITLGVVFLHDPLHWALIPGGLLLVYAGHLTAQAHRRESAMADA